MEQEQQQFFYFFFPQGSQGTSRGTGGFHLIDSRLSGRGRPRKLFLLRREWEWTAACQYPSAQKG